MSYMGYDKVSCLLILSYSPGHVSLYPKDSPGHVSLYPKDSPGHVSLYPKGET